VVFLPPLRERMEDIPLLANHFASRMAFEMDRSETPIFAPETLKLLENYPWPGNIRELKNVVERAVYRTDDTVIREIVFDPFEKFRMNGNPQHAPTPPVDQKITVTDDILKMPLQEAVWALKVRMLKSALISARHNQRKAADLLGLTYHQFRGLYRTLKSDIQKGPGQK